VRIVNMDLKLPEISARELLLHPMNLLHQVSTALVPGILVFFLLMLKHSPLIAHSTSATGMLGYKSRIVLLLLIAFIVGRVVQSMTVIGLKILLKAIALWNSWRDHAKASTITAAKTGIQSATTSETDSQKQTPASESVTLQRGNETQPIEEIEVNSSESAPEHTVPKELTPAQQTARAFYMSLLMGTVLARDGSAFDSFEAKRANLGLAAAAGVVLIIGSCYPGDGLRLQELAGGIFLFVASVIDGHQLNQLKIEAIGSAVGQVIASHTVKENVEILSMAAKVLPVITKHINPEDSEMQSAEMMQEIAERSTSKAALTGNNRQPNRRDRGRNR
jgi:hypothetical protein